MSVLLPACKSDNTEEFLPNCIYYYYYYCSFIFLSHYGSHFFHIYCYFHCHDNGDISHVLFFIRTLSDCFHLILQFPLQLPCLLQQSLTQICMYTFGCFLDSTIACTNRSGRTRSLLLDQWLGGESHEHLMF